MDFIFVRGPYSLSILQDKLNFKSNVAVALDSGFGAKLIYPNLFSIKRIRKSRLRIVVIPRIDFLSYIIKGTYINRI